MASSSTDLIQAAEYVENLARHYKHMSKVADALKRVGSLEGAEQETLARLEGLKQQISEHEVLLESAKMGVKAADADAETILKQADAKAGEVLNQAIESTKAKEQKLKAEFGQRLHDSQVQVAEANKTAHRIVRDAQTAADAKLEEATRITDAIEKSKAELAELEDKIARAREAAKRMMED